MYCSEGYLVLLQFLHVIWQTMFGPPILHKFPSYFAYVSRDTIQNKFLKLWQMLAPPPREHLTNTNQSETSDILVTFSKGGRQRLNLRTKSLQHAGDSGISSEKVQALPPKHSNRLLHIMAKPGQFFAQQVAKRCALSRFIFFRSAFSFTIAACAFCKSLNEATIVRGQSSFTMLNLCHLGVRSSKLRTQRCVSFLELGNAQSVAAPLQFSQILSTLNKCSA
jgi:hypothetical protein